MTTYNTVAITGDLQPSPVAVIWDHSSIPGALQPSPIAVVWPAAQEPGPGLSSSSLVLVLDPQAVRISSGTVAAGYRMRAYDATLGRDVFWSSAGIDSSGSGYGGPGPLSDIVVHMRLGT